MRKFVFFMCLEAHAVQCFACQAHRSELQRLLRYAPSASSCCRLGLICRHAFSLGPTHASVSLSGVGPGGALGRAFAAIEMIRMGVGPQQLDLRCLGVQTPGSPRDNGPFTQIEILPALLVLGTLSPSERSRPTIPWIARRLVLRGAGLCCGRRMLL